MHWYPMEGLGIIWPIIGLVFMLLFIVLLAALIWGLTDWLRRQGSGGNTGLDAAKERYGRGEITKKEFEEIKKSLS